MSRPCPCRVRIRVASVCRVRVSRPCRVRIASSSRRFRVFSCRTLRVASASRRRRVICASFARRVPRHALRVASPRRGARAAHYRAADARARRRRSRRDRHYISVHCITLHCVALRRGGIALEPRRPLTRRAAHPALFGTMACATARRCGRWGQETQRALERATEPPAARAGGGEGGGDARFHYPNVPRSACVSDAVSHTDWSPNRDDMTNCRVCLVDTM